MTKAFQAWLLAGLLLSSCTGGHPSTARENDSATMMVMNEKASEHLRWADDERWIVDGVLIDRAGPMLRSDSVSPQAVELGLTPKPARASYQPGQFLQLEPLARDALGERVFGIRFTFTATPAEAVERVPGMPGRYELLDEGAISFEVCASEQLCTSLRVVVDAGSPLLVVEEPAEGAALGGDGRDEIMVRGSVADARESWVWVDDQPVSVDELGRFEASIPAHFGVNPVVVTASDGVSSQTQVRRDVLWAPSYLPTNAGVSSLPDAALLSLGQSFFDDRIPLDASAPPHSDDVADIIALVVQHAELTPLLPDPLVDGGAALSLRVTDVRPREVSVDLDIVDGGLELFVRIARLEVDTAGGMDLDGTSVSLDGGLTASLSILAQLAMRVDPSSGVKVELSEFHTMLESATGRFVAKEANAVFQLAQSALRNKLEDALSGVLSDVLVGQLPGLLEGALQSLEGLLRDRQFTLNVAPLPEQTLVLDGRFAEARLAYRRSAQLDLDLTVGTDASPLHPNAPGVPQRAAPPVVEAFEGRDMELALRMDLINLVLHTLWNGGLLELHGADAKVAGELGDLLAHVSVSGKLPPVLRAAHPWEDADAMLELGQLELSFDLGERARYGVSARLPVDVQVRDGVLRLDLGRPEIEGWLIESTAEHTLSGEELTEIAEPLLLPILDDALNGHPIALELPHFSASELTQIAPDLANFELTLSPGADVLVRGDALVIDLSLIGASP